MFNNDESNRFNNGEDGINFLTLRPLLGISSPFIQTVIPYFFYPGKEPPSESMIISLKDGDSLYCLLTTPPSWKPHEKTIVIVHGLGGSHQSNYMVRLCRKCFEEGYRVLRVNLRCAGPGFSFAHRPYHAGTSDDILQILESLKQNSSTSPVILIGFSLGGNIVLKLLGELGDKARQLIACAIAICPPINLVKTTQNLLKPSNRFYHRYYLRCLRQLGYKWLGKRTIHSIIEYDHLVTAPNWGYQDAFDYYEQCSSDLFIPSINQLCHLMFAADDPFVDFQLILGAKVPSCVNVWISSHGGHMGFLGWSGEENRYHWLDDQILRWIKQVKPSILLD